MYPTTGYTPTVSNLQQAKNILARMHKTISPEKTRELCRLLIRDCDEVNGEFVRQLNNIAHNIECHPSTDALVTLANAMQSYERNIAAFGAHESTAPVSAAGCKAKIGV